MSGITHDIELLNAAEQSLVEMGFETDRAEFESVPCVIAEDEFFILAIVAAASIDELVLVDEAVSLRLASEVATADVAGKQWDVYLVLLTSDSVPAGESEATFSLSYNTHYLRRLVRTGVTATTEGARVALKPFADLTAEVAASPQDPLAELEELLPSHGTSSELAHRAIEVFRSTGEVPDV